MLNRKSAYVVAIIGATGAVGKESLDILEERKFPLESLRLFGSKRSAGEVMTCQGREWKVEELTPTSSFRGIDSIPNCTTTPLVMALKPLHEAAGVKRVVVTTFQSVSGTGSAAMNELLDQTRALMSFREVKADVYPYQIAFNLLPHIGSFSEGGDCSEEVKIRCETQKILDAPH